MSRTFVAFLLIFQTVGAFALTSEEEAERQRVINEYSRQDIQPKKETPPKAKTPKPSLTDQTKDKMGEVLKDIKDKLPDNIQNMMGEKDQPKEVEVSEEQKEKDEKEHQDLMSNLDSNPFLKMLSKEQRETAAKMMKKNPFSTMKKDAIKSLILNKMDPKKPVGKFLQDSPKLVDAAAEWVIDDKAIPAFISIINKPEKGKKVGIIFIVVFISIFLINLKNSKMHFVKRIFFKIGLMFASAAINLGAFYIIYKEELTPSIDVFSKYM